MGLIPSAFTSRAWDFYRGSKLPHSKVCPYLTNFSFRRHAHNRADPMTTLAISTLLLAPAAADSLQATVDRVVRPVMRHHGIPGMSVAVTVDVPTRWMVTW